MADRKKIRESIVLVPFREFFRGDAEISCNRFNQPRRIVFGCSMFNVHGKRFAATRKSNPFIVPKFERADHAKSLKELLELPSMQFRILLHTATSMTWTWLSGIKS